MLRALDESINILQAARKKLKQDATQKGIFQENHQFEHSKGDEGW